MTTSQNLVYLWDPLLSAENDVSQEVKRRLMSTNKCYYGLSKYFKSKLLTRGTKLGLYKTLTRPVLVYASETWTILKADECQCSKESCSVRFVAQYVKAPAGDIGTTGSCMHY